MTSVRRALALSFIEKYALIGLSLVSYVVIARLLTPEQIGIYSVAMAFIGVAQVIRDFGIGNFLIQQKNLSESHIGTALGVSLLLGGGMFLLFAIASSFIGEFYRDERMTAIVRIVALNFLIIPFCSISMSLLRRNMEFGRLMVVNVVAAVLSLALTLILAWCGYGPQSLAWGAIASNAIGGIGAWIARKERAFIRPSLTQWREIVSFGGQSTLAGIVTSVAMDINDLVVGRVMGFTPVAILSRAQGLMNLCHRDLMSAVRNVAFPTFAKAHRNGEAVEPLYVASITVVTAFAWPFYGLIALYPIEILRIFFGIQWDSAAPLVPIFALAGACSATFSLIPSVIMAVGRIELVTRAELIFQPIRIFMIVGAVLIFRSLEACALAFCLSFAIGVPLFYSVKELGLKNNIPELMSGLRKSALVTLVSLSVAIVCSIAIGLNREVPLGFVQFALICAISLIFWVAGIILLKHPVSIDPLFRRITQRFLPVIKGY